MHSIKAHNRPSERGRITARVPQSVMDTLERAANLVGSTLNQFVTQAALEKADKVLEKERLQLSQEDVSALFSLLDNPPEPTAALINDFTAYQTRKIQNAGPNSSFEFNPSSKVI